MQKGEKVGKARKPSPNSPSSLLSEHAFSLVVWEGGGINGVGSREASDLNINSNKFKS